VGVTGVVDRMIARARAPLSPVRPLLPSRYEWDHERVTAETAAPVEDVSEQWTAPPPDSTTAGASETAAVDGPHSESTAAEIATETGRAAPSAERGAADSPPAVRPAPAARPMPRTDRALPPAAAHDGPGRAAMPGAARPGLAAPADPAAPFSTAARREAAGPAETSFRAPRPPVEERSEGPRDGSGRETSPPPRARAAAEPDERQARRGTTEVSISIGQIEVRAVPPVEPRRKPAPRPRVSLAEYLRRRGEAGR